MTSTSLAEPPCSTPDRLELHGDESELYRRHHRALLARTRRAVRAPEALIEDACQFAWLALCRHQPERDNVLAWLGVVARHEALRLVGQWKRLTPASSVSITDERGNRQEFDPDLTPAPERDPLDALDARATFDALAALKPAQRSALALKAFGFSYREIQRLCGDRTYTWVNRHITEGRAALRAQAPPAA